MFNLHPKDPQKRPICILLQGVWFIKNHLETLLFRPDSYRNPVGKETPVPGEFRTSVVGATWQGPIQ